jgi:uncharacterized RDD family membrane protein YckC
MSETVRYAGFWLRFLAMMIDTVLLTAVTFPLLLAIYGLPDLSLRGDLSDLTTDRTAQYNGPAGLVIQYVLPAIAAIVFWKYKSATPGKMILSIKIVDARHGGSLSVTQCLIRYFAYLVSMLPLGLGFLWIAFDKRKQAWHDKLAGTIVVRAEEATEAVLVSVSSVSSCSDVRPVNQT